MEDREKELSSQDGEKSGIFKNTKSLKPTPRKNDNTGIEENITIEDNIIEKISSDYLNYSSNNLNFTLQGSQAKPIQSSVYNIVNSLYNNNIENTISNINNRSNNLENTYSSFRKLASYKGDDYNLTNVNPLLLLLNNNNNNKNNNNNNNNNNKFLDSTIEKANTINLLNKNSNSSSSINNSSDFKEYYFKSTERNISEEESKKVFIIINSFGGDISSGIAISDCINFIKAGTTSLGLGFVGSAATLVLSSATIGNRFITEGCSVLIHQPEGNITGQASSIYLDSKEILKIRSDVASIYSLNTYKPKSVILRDLDRDFILRGSEAVNYGLVDSVATNEYMSSLLQDINSAWSLDNNREINSLEKRINNNSATTNSEPSTDGDGSMS